MVVSRVLDVWYSFISVCPSIELDDPISNLRTCLFAPQTVITCGITFKIISVSIRLIWFEVISILKMEHLIIKLTSTVSANIIGK